MGMHVEMRDKAKYTKRKVGQMRDNNMDLPPKGNNLPKGYKNIVCLREWFRDTKGQYNQAV